MKTIEGIKYAKTPEEGDFIELSELGLELKSDIKLNQDQIDFLLNSWNKIPEWKWKIDISEYYPNLKNHTDEEIKFFMQ